jgi:hypothetical protein
MAGDLKIEISSLIDAFDEQMITEEQFSYYKIKIQGVEKLLNGYINYLERRSPC